MNDHAGEVRRALTDATQLCRALGLLEGARKNGSNGLLIRCPSHGENEASCGVTAGPDGTLRARCFSCQWSADALGMIAQVRGLNTRDREQFLEVLAEGAEIAGLGFLADEIRGGTPAPDRENRIPPPPAPLPPVEYPPADEVEWLWQQSGSVADVGSVGNYLVSRAIDPSAAAERGLLRALTEGQNLPAWAGTRRPAGGGPCERTWVDTGHRIITRAWDATGTCRSVRAWLIDSLSDAPKRLPPPGHKAAGLVLANKAAVTMLRGKEAPRRVVVTEGEPDFVSNAVRIPESSAVIGILSGSWSDDFAGHVPSGCEVVVRTHCDSAGEKYAAQVIASLSGRCPIWRLRIKTKQDDNDLAKSGKLTSDPFVGCVAANDAAKQADEERPQILTVQDLLVGSHRRATAQERPKALSWGNWRVDRMTGGIRPAFCAVLASDTSWGKSTKGVAVADENIKHGARVLIVSLEDDESMYADRLMARRSRVNALRLRDRKLTPEEHVRVAGVIAKAEPIPCFIDGRLYNYERLNKIIAECIEDEDIDLTILDYIQEARMKQKCEDDRRMFREIARLFRRTVKRAYRGRKRSGLIMSQITLSEPGKAPTKQDIRECRDIAHGAEIIALGWTPAADIVKDHEVLFKANTRILKIDKAKDGIKGLVALRWCDESACFDAEYSDEYSIPGYEPEPPELDDVWARGQEDAESEDWRDRIP